MSGSGALECRICSNQAGNRPWMAYEMMLGTRTPFRYFECASCGCLQIETIPADLDRYYPGDYYSFDEPPSSRGTGIGARLKSWRDGAELRGAPWIGRLLAWRQPNRELAALRGLGLKPGARILDVGAGRGRMLRMFGDLGFRSLAGIDTHLPSAKIVHPGFSLFRKSIFECEEEYDLVMFSHSFEHMEDPQRVLAQTRKLLDPSGACFLRIPTSSSFAWRHYRTDWVQLDAPRHFYLHSTASLERVVRAAGFRIESLRCDSSALQFWGSEQYRSGIPLFSEQSYAKNPAASMFNRADLRAFHRRARELDRRGEGDEIVVILRPEAQ